MIEFRIVVDDIDYKTLAETILPVLKAKLENNSDDSFKQKSLLGMLNVAGNFPVKMLDTLSQKKKDELAVKLVNSKQDIIKGVVLDIAHSKEIQLSVNEIDARIVNTDKENTDV